MEYLIFIALGYLLGSVPFGLITGRLAKGIDIRSHGSGSTGMTNVWRTVGVPAAIIVLVLDMAKSILAVVIAMIFSGVPTIEMAAALSVLAGHNWPIFSRFRGGKGIASGWAGLFVLSPVAGLIGGVVGISTIAIWRYASLGSLLGTASGAASLIILVVLDYSPTVYSLYSTVAVPLIVFRHRDNIARLVKGKERKLERHVKA